MKYISTLTGILLCCSISFAESEQSIDKPNILWITSEDNSFQWLGCYGSADASTPRLDEFATYSTLFTKAYSNAAVCAVARSTLLTGLYAPSIGTQHQRSRYSIPKHIKPYVTYLREAGYYCTNNSKTDYNFAGKDKSYWDDCSNKAHYKNRPAGKPFFAIFNVATSHESSLFPRVVKKRRDQGIIPNKPRLDPQKISLPPYVPDLAEMRNDWAIYHDNISAMDNEFGLLLDELEENSLADNTIVFYYADHGGATPRGKRYLTETGVRIPLIIHFPEKWKHLSPFAAGERINEMVSFVDFAPTLLSICGIKKPKQMIGREFLGNNRVEPDKNQEVYLFADRFDEIAGMRRGYTDGRYKYIRCFTPQLAAAPYSYYQFGQPSWQAWEKAWQEGELSGRYHEIWEANQPVEYLFDLETDPWEVHNIAGDVKYKSQIDVMRRRLKKLVIEAKDTSLVPEPIIAQLKGVDTAYDFVRSDSFDIELAVEVAYLASERNIENIPKLSEALISDDPVIRYWGAIGFQVLGSQSKVTDELLPLLSDDETVVRITAAKALVLSGDKSAKDIAIRKLISELDSNINDQAILLLINTLKTLDISNEIPDQWVQRALNKKNVNQYVKRYAKLIQASRQ